MISQSRVITRTLASSAHCPRPRKRKHAAARKPRLAILPLEERVVPFNYTVNNNAEGALVEIIGTDGTAAGVTDNLGIAAIDNPPTPAPGIGGTALWGADVILPPGYDFYISKDFAVGGPYLSGGSVFNAITYTVLDDPTPTASCETCSPGTNLLPKSDPNNAGAGTAGAELSSTKVRYFDGVASITDADIESDGFGMPWSQTRSWSNGVRAGDLGIGNTLQGYGFPVGGGSTTSLSLNHRLGQGWVNNMLPRLRFIGDDFFQSGTSSSGAYFHKTGTNTWSPMLFRKSTASVVAGEVVITDELGNRTVFFDNTATPANRRGQFKRFVRANGDVIAVEGQYTALGDVQEIRRSQGQSVESWVYTYEGYRMTAVELRRSTDGGTSWQYIRSVEYRYTDWTGLNSPARQLTAAIVHSGDRNGPTLETKYYRYYSHGQANGFQSALKYVVSPSSFDRLAAAYNVTSITEADALTDAQIEAYADIRLEYTSDHRVKKQVIQGEGCSVCTAGQGTYEFSYYTNPNYSLVPAPADDPLRFGEWLIRTTETLPDGNQNIVYLNSVGQAILKVFKDTSSGREWSTFRRFDSKGRVVWVADPSAVMGRDDQYGDLLHRVNGNFEFLSDSSGLITGYEYGKTTTATESQPGDVEGFLKSEFRRQGEMGTGYEIIASNKYYSHSANDITIHPLAAATSYPAAPQAVPLSDDFSSDDWTYLGGSWAVANGVLSQSDTSDGTTKMAVLADRAWAANQEIVASVRVDSWIAGENAWAGVSVRTNSSTGQGYGLVFNGTNQVRFANFGVTWGNSCAFTWEPGTWYRFRLRADGAILSGKVWRADQTEPTGWMFTQTGWGDKVSGSPGLNGGATWSGQGSATASFENVQVSQIVYPPLPSPQTVDDFSSIDGWKFVGGTWRTANGVLSQSETADGTIKMAVQDNQSWAADQEIVASVRIDSWVAGGNAWAGVSVRTNSTTGLGYGLVFNGTNQVRFANFGLTWGNTYSFTWQTGTWYRFRLKIEGSTLSGKVWEASGSEPTDWMFTQTGWTDKPTGSPGLNGGATWTGQGSATASFDDVQITAEASSASDSFSASQPGAAWTYVGGGSWQEASGRLAQTNTAVSNGKTAVLADRSWGADQEIVASVRVDWWAGGVYARAGVMVRTNSVTGQGYGLVFNGTNQIKFVDDGVTWGNTYAFTWQTGTWYRFRLRIENEVLYGKVWEVGQTEPTGWMFTQSGWGSKPTGSPALNGGASSGGSDNSTVSFDDVQAAGSPPASPDITTTSEPFSGVAWTLVGGSWQQIGGVFSQNGTTNGTTKMAALVGPAWVPDQEIAASVRVDSWVSGESARAGVSVRTDPTTGLAYGLVFNGANQVRFLNGTTWGNSYSFSWQMGTWYRFRLRAEKDILLGKVWQVGQSEPVAWMFRQDGWTDKPNGSPALNGGAAWTGQGSSTVSFDDIAAINLAPTNSRTTTYAYQWYTGVGGNQPQNITVQLPTVPTSQNGPGTPDLVTTAFNPMGQAVWVRDEEGFLHYREFDVPTGSLVKDIADVNTALSADFTGLPFGWTTPTGGGTHLKTTYTVDQYGRETGVTYPTGRVDYTRYNDLTHEVRYYPGWTGTTTTGPVEVAHADRIGGTVTVDGQPRRYLFKDWLTMVPASIPVDGQGRPTGAEPISNVLTLSREYTSPAGQTLWRDDYFSLAGLTYLDGNGNAAFSLGTQGTNFYRTQFTFNNRGWLNRTITPAGTIYRTDFDGLGRPTAEWVGTIDGTGSNMVQTTGYEFDGGNVGDSNLTKVTLKPGLGQADRVSQTWYDWRDRPVASKSGIEATEATWVNRPLVVCTFDNLGELTRCQQYDGDAVTPTFSNGELVPISSSYLRAQTDTLFDEQGRAYQVTQSAVNPVTGALTGRTLTSNVWFDHRGQVVKSAPAGGAVIKSVYDGAGRLVKQYATDGGGDATWADAFTVAGDIVLTQVEKQYDGLGNTLFAVIRDRFHDATLTGELGDPTSTTQAKARVSYSAAYYDILGRMTAAVDVGTNGGTAWTRPGTAPAASDTVLVTGFGYNSFGWQDTVTDPRGVIGKTEYDPLGRVTKTIVNYVDGVPSDTDDKTIVYGFDSVGRATTVTALLTSGQQVTESVYGVTTTNGHGLNSNDLAAETRFPDATTGASSASVRSLSVVDALGEVTQSTARNGTVHQFTFDPVGRQLADAVTTLATGVDGTVRRIEFAYDGQGHANRVSSLDATTGYGYVNDVYREFNGLGQLARETQGTNGIAVLGTSPAVQFAYSGEGAGSANHSRPTSLTYPNGRVLTFNYSSGLNDTVSRLSSIGDGATTLEAYDFLGANQIVRRAHPQPGVDNSAIKLSGEPNGDAGDQYTGLDRFSRLVDERWVNGSGADVDRFKYGYDRVGNRRYKENVLDPTRSDLYTHDSLDRLISFARGTLNTAKDGLTGTASRSQSWDFDALGNWDSVTTNGSAQTRTANKRNEITSVSGATTPAYDANGNLTTDETGRTFKYDAWDRLVEVRDSANNLLATFRYDGLGRRVRETRGGTTTDLYYSPAAQVLEERVGGVVQSQYVWSPDYFDALVERDRDTNADGTLDERLYAAHDANFNVTAVFDTSGNVVERYAYDPFGAATVLTPAFASRSSTLYVWDRLHQGLEFLSEIGLYSDRARWLSPSLGRFTSVDPLGFGGGDANFYGYVGNGPTGGLDPSGLDWEDRNIWEPLGQMYNGNARFRGLVNGTEQVARGLRDIPFIVRDAGASVYSSISGNPVNLYSDYAAGLEQARQEGRAQQYAEDAERNVVTFGLYGLTKEGIRAAQEYIETGDSTQLDEFSGELLAYAGAIAPTARVRGGCADRSPQAVRSAPSPTSVPTESLFSRLKRYLAPDVRTLEPVTDTARPVYERGHPGEVVIEHRKARCLSGDPEGWWNKSLEPREYNSRKGNYEKQLKDARAELNSGLSENPRFLDFFMRKAAIDHILQGELDWIMNDVLGRTGTGEFLETLPGK